MFRKASQGLKGSQLFSIYYLAGVLPPLHILRSIPFVLVFKQNKKSQGLKGSQLFSIYYFAGVLPPLHSNYYLSIT